VSAVINTIIILKNVETPLNVQMTEENREYLRSQFFNNSRGKIRIMLLDNVCQLTLNLEEIVGIVDYAE
jgi:hypothetical protein